MTALTLGTVLTQMDVIFAMTGRAILCQLHFVSWFYVALRTLERAVRAGERETRLRMIKHPGFPAVRRVAGRAVLAKASLVHVIVRMTAVAGDWRAFEGLGCMTLGAACDRM